MTEDNKIGYKALIDSELEESESSYEEYGEWSEYWSHYWRGIRRLREGEYSDVNSSIDFKPGETVYVVWIVYSEGDSFGYAQNKRAEVIAVFNNPEDAKILEEIIRRESGFTIKYDSIDGQHLDIYPGWTGYFESLEQVNIETELMGV